MNSVIDGQVPLPVEGRGKIASGANRFSPVNPERQPFSLRRLLAFMGPGYLIAVGYMDPGNWATSLAGGSVFGYALLSVLLLSNVMAMLLQAASVRLGMACGLNLLFHIPLTFGVCLTALDVILVLVLARRGVRYLEAVIIGLVTLVGACLLVQLWWLHPALRAVVAGFTPTSAIVRNPEMLYLAVGIVGATVMPHNLYLHSSIVQSRPHDGSMSGIRQAIRYATLDSNIALTFALLVNVGIMVLAAGAFHHSSQGTVVDLNSAYRLLAPLLGVHAASAVFGIGLIGAGLSSSITGTLAGQVVMDGFLQLRLSRLTRAMVTRGLALIPAAAVAAAFGEAGMGKLLVLSQFILGIQLPFAVIPLLWFTTRRAYLGGYAFKPVIASLLWLTAALVVIVNAWAIYSFLK